MSSSVLNSIKRDFGLLLKRSYLLPFLPFPLKFSDPKSEHHNFEEFIFADNSNPPPSGTQYVHSDRWFFANGVVSDRHAWKVQADLASDIFQKKIEPLFNPTYTIAVDLIECVQGRTFNRLDESAENYLRILKPVISSGQEVHIIAYSQGGIVVSNVIKTLIEEGYDLSKVSVYTFGSAHDEFNFDGKLFSEHFANKNDYVASIGVIHFRAGKAPVYIGDKFGHFFNAHYMRNFVKKSYCGGASKLYSMVKNK